MYAGIDTAVDLRVAQDESRLEHVEHVRGPVNRP